MQLLLHTDNTSMNLSMNRSYGGSVYATINLKEEGQTQPADNSVIILSTQCFATCES
jgi:hypothetical protein